MSESAIESLQRSIDALSARIGTQQERKPDREMVAYLRGRIAEIQDANKKAAGQRTQAATNHKLENILADSDRNNSCTDADLRFVNAEVRR
jgi:hypothetical protein